MTKQTQKPEGENRINPNAEAEAKAAVEATAQAEADAAATAAKKAEAQATADAEAKAVADEAAKKAKAEGKDSKPRKAKAPVLDAAKLRELIAQVEGGNTQLQRRDLICRLETEEGAKIDEDGLVFNLTMAGVTGTANTGGEAGMLANWCNAARRKCLSGEAV